jgi:hypothetical protein
MPTFLPPGNPSVPSAAAICRKYNRPRHFWLPSEKNGEMATYWLNLGGLRESTQPTQPAQTLPNHNTEQFAIPHHSADLNVPTAVGAGA